MCKGSPRDVRTEQAASFVADALHDRPRVLEVSWPATSVASRLASLGFHVTTLQAAPAEPVAGVRYVAADLMSFDEEPFDAVLLTGVLHRVDSLEHTLAHVDGLLKPGGRLIVDDLDLDAPDLRTLRWYFDTLVSHRLVQKEPAESQLLAAWDAQRQRGGAHGGAAIRHALSERFAVRNAQRVEYLYRDVAALVPDDEAGAKLVRHVRERERELVANGTITAVGLQIVLDRKPAVGVCSARLSDTVACSLEPGHAGLHRWLGPNGRTFDWG